MKTITIILFSIIFFAGFISAQEKLEKKIAAQDSLILFLQQQILKKAYEDNAQVTMILPNGKKVLFYFRDEVVKHGMLISLKKELADSVSVEAKQSIK